MRSFVDWRQAVPLPGVDQLILPGKRINAI